MYTPWRDNLSRSPLTSHTPAKDILMATENRASIKVKSAYKTIPIRSLAEPQRADILAHLLALNPQDRYLRFGYAANDSHIHAYVAQLNFERDEIYGIYNRKLKLIAMAHLAFNPSPALKYQVEFGVSVDDKSRGKGFGAKLFDRALLHARNEGATEMIIHALSENVAMLKIATHAGARVVRDGAESEAFLALPPATFGSQVGELVDEQVGEFDYTFKMQAKSMSDLIHDLTKPVAKSSDSGS
jgi:GNAT superfamily N-acetyltransferase